MRPPVLGLGLVGLAAPACTSVVVCGEGTVLDAGVCVAVPPETAASDGTDGFDGADGADGFDGADGTDGMPDTGTPSDGTVDVYLLAGQSNMAGYGQTVSLPPSLRVAQDDAFVYWSQRPSWVGLQPSSDLGTRFMGPEVTFGRALADATGRPAYLIKHAVGGTDLANFWDPGIAPDDPNMGEGYRVFSQTVSEALAALEAQGLTPVVRGMVWMQGESDAVSATSAAAYADNLSALVARVREDTGVAFLPFVAAQIDCRSVCDAHRDAVNAAMVAVAEADAQVFTFPTEDLSRYPFDAWHYQGPGVRALGRRFAARLLGEPLPPLPRPALTVTGSYDASYTGNYTVGWSFSLSEPIWVTDLGQFDLGWDGLSHDTTVALWDDTTGSLLAQADVPSLAAAWSPLVGNFVYAALEPVALEPGDYVIGVQSYEWNPDYYVYNAGITESEAVRWGTGRHVGSTVLSFPTAVVTGSVDQAAWLGPNFLYVPQ